MIGYRLGLIALLFAPPLRADSFAGWIWDEQVKPTIAAADNADSLWTFAAVALATSGAHQYDSEVREKHGDNQKLSREQAHYGAVLGSGFPGILVAAAQIAWDRENGLMHARSLGFTATTHITIALAVQRERPNGKNLSFPSGHTSSSFATATSLAYAYGAPIGVPAYLLATYIGYSRVANNAHWISDTVAGAGLGIFWAHASAQVRKEKAAAAWNPILERGRYGWSWGLGWQKTF